jgi:hypothetical protein
VISGSLTKNFLFHSHVLFKKYVLNRIVISNIAFSVTNSRRGGIHLTLFDLGIVLHASWDIDGGLHDMKRPWAGNSHKGILLRFRDRDGEDMVQPFQRKGKGCRSQPVSIPSTQKQISRTVVSIGIKEDVY